eukprot:COSAG06_NODE_41692_length_388_cov_3.017301_1_plen_32_part_10
MEQSRADEPENEWEEGGARCGVSHILAERRRW